MALTLQENILRLSDGGEGTVIAETAEEVSAIINTLKREGMNYQPAFLRNEGGIC